MSKHELNIESLQQKLITSSRSSSSDPEQKSRRSCLNIENSSSAFVYIATSPQGPLGGLMPFLALNLISKEKTPALYYSVFGTASLTGAALAYVIIRARSMVLTPYVIEEIENIYKKLSRQSPIESKEKMSCKKKGVDALVMSADILTATNMSLVFAGFNDIACDTLSQKLADADMTVAENLGSVVGSTPFEAVFSFASLTMNILLFYSVQKFLRFKTIEIARPAWRYVTEAKTTYASRQQLLSALDYVKQKNIDLINSNIDMEELPAFSSEETILESKAIQPAILALQSKAFTDPELQSLIQTLSTLTIPGDMQKKIMTPFKHRFYAGTFWVTAMIGLWSFFYSQQQATQGFIALFVDQDEAETAANIILNNFGKYLMVLSMAAFYFHIIVINSLTYFGRHRQITCDQSLPGKGSCFRYWLPRVWFISLAASLVNVAATLSALDDGGISWQSFLGIFLLSTSLIGPTLMEVFGIHRFYLGKALSQLKNEKGENFLTAVQFTNLLDDCRAEIAKLTAPEIKQLAPKGASPATPARQESFSLWQCLRNLFTCCCKKQNHQSPDSINRLQYN